MTLTKAYVKYIGGSDTFWIDPINCFEVGVKAYDNLLIKVYDNHSGKPFMDNPITLNMSNVIYIRWYEEVTK